MIPMVIISACMKDDYEAVTEECPRILSTNPTSDDPNVDVSSNVTVIFNKEMCFDSVEESFFLISGSDTIRGDIFTDDNKTYVFRPSDYLRANSAYRAVITKDVADCYGLTLVGGDYDWGFQTKNDYPKVTELLPVPGDENVKRNTLIRIRFDRALRIETISPDMFELKDSDGNDVEVLEWSLGNDNRELRFNIDNLEASTYYNAKLEGRIEDLLGYYLEEPITWSFRTSLEFELIPRSVNLRTAHRFAIFSSEFITNVGAITTVRGDVGIIPGMINDISGDINIDGETVADGDSPVDIINPVLITAKNDLVTAYNFASNTPIPEPQPVSGVVFTPGIYYIDSYNINTNITLDAEGDPDAFWIFRIDSSLMTANNIDIILTNFAHANNVFWKVGDTATIGENTTFKGTIMARNDIVMMDGASITGRLMVIKDGITLHTNSVIIP